MPMSTPVKVPRWPPASVPWAMIASTPRRSNILASATVVALQMMKIPAPLMASIDLRPRQAEMEAHHLRLCAQEHREVLAADLACRSLGLRDRAQALGIVVGLQTLAHRLARLGRDLGLRPERIVDVQAAAALLPEAGDAPLCILGREAPHAETAEATGVTDGSGERGGAEPSHRRLQDGPLEIEPLGERVPRPHRCSSPRGAYRLAVTYPMVADTGPPTKAPGPWPQEPQPRPRRRR